MADTQKPQPYNTLDQQGPATAKNQQTEISRLQSIITALAAISTSVAAGATEANQELEIDQLTLANIKLSTISSLLSLINGSVSTEETLQTVVDAINELINNEANIGDFTPESIARRLAEQTYLENYRNNMKVLIASESRGVSNRGFELR